MNGTFTEEDFQALGAWLLRRRTGMHDIVTLEGFLTAIVIGPNTLMPTIWLPKVWGGRGSGFRDLKEMNRFVALVMGLHNDIAQHFELDSAGFEPTFYESTQGRKPILIVDEWCEGFIKGMRLDAKAWQVLAKDRPELLKPMKLFGTRAGWRELNAGGDVKMHATWSVRVAPAVRDIYAYWLPHRRAQLAAGDDERRVH